MRDMNSQSHSTHKTPADRRPEHTSRSLKAATTDRPPINDARIVAQFAQVHCIDDWLGG